MQIRIGLFGDFFAGNYVDGHGGLGDGTRLGARSNDHQFFEHDHLFENIRELDRGGIRTCGGLALLRDGRAAHGERDAERERRNAGERLQTIPVWHGKLLSLGDAGLTDDTCFAKKN